MTTCTNCGRETGSGTTTCPFCGTPLNPQTTGSDARECPHCGETIPADSITCRFCNRQVNRVDTPTHPLVAVLQNPQSIPAESLTQADVDHVFEAWAASYANIPEGVRERVSSSIPPITKDWMLDIVEQWFRYKVSDDRTIQQVMTQVNARCFQWAMLASAIGAEAALGGIPDPDVPYYVSACQRPIVHQLLSYLAALVEKNRIKEKRSKEKIQELSSYMSQRALFLANWGYVCAMELQPKHQPGTVSPLAAQLLRLDLTELKRERGEVA